MDIIAMVQGFGTIGMLIFFFVLFLIGAFFLGMQSNTKQYTKFWGLAVAAMFVISAFGPSLSAIGGTDTTPATPGTTTTTGAVYGLDSYMKTDVAATNNGSGSTANATCMVLETASTFNEATKTFSIGFDRSTDTWTGSAAYATIVLTTQVEAASAETTGAYYIGVKQSIPTKVYTDGTTYGPIAKLSDGRWEVTGQFASETARYADIGSDVLTWSYLSPGTAKDLTIKFYLDEAAWIKMAKYDTFVYTFSIVDASGKVYDTYNVLFYDTS